MENKTRKNKNSDPKPVLIQNIQLTQIQRNTQDIEKWRSALRAAESTTNPNRTVLYDLYFDILLDGHLTSLTTKRKFAISNSPIIYRAKDGEVDTLITDLIQSPNFLELIHHIIDTRFWGYSVIEVNYVDGSIFTELVPRKHVKPELGIITPRQTDRTGIDFTTNPYALAVGDTKDLGLLLQSAQYVIYKRCGFGDWLQFAELFGMPFRIGKYDGYDENARRNLQKALEEAGSAAYAVIPEGTDISFVDSFTKTPASGLYDDIIKASNAELSKLILGQTMTTEQGENGARSLGEVHADVEASIHNADRVFLKHVLNFKLKPLLENLGMKFPEGKFDYEDIDPIPLKDRFTIDSELSKIVPIGDDYFYSKYKVPKPANYEALKKEMSIKLQTPDPIIKNAKAKSWFSNFFE